jgi:hypothetical protein
LFIRNNKKRVIKKGKVMEGENTMIKIIPAFLIVEPEKKANRA